MEERNFIVFIILTFAVIFIFTMNMPKPKPQEQDAATDNKTETTQKTQTAEPTQPATLDANSPVQVAVGEFSAPETQPEPQQDQGLTRPEVPEQIIMVRTPLYTATLTNKGAVPLKWELAGLDEERAILNEVCNKYEVEFKWPPIKTHPGCNDRPVDMVNPKLSDKGFEHLPLRTLIRYGSTQIPDGAMWNIEDEQKEISVPQGSYDLKFTYPLSEDNILTKTFTFRAESYSLGYSIDNSAPAPDKQQIAAFEMRFLFEPLDRLSRMNFNGPLSDNGTKVDKVDVKDVIKSEGIVREDVNWAGFTDSYFLTAIIQNEEQKMDWRATFEGSEQNKKDKKAAKELAGVLVVYPSSTMKSQGELCDLTLFLGPKRRGILGQTHERLVYAIDYGMLWMLVQPLLWLLNMVNKVVNNYGVSIIIVTIFMRMAMFPLTRKSQESMKDLAKLQPEMQKVRDKFPDDKLKQQEEMSSLMKKHEINPLGGCLPMLLQFPVFIAFYKALIISIELRHAPFFAWIQDLSAKDPLLIWPVLMGGSQLLMQKMTPATNMDPRQRQMMMLMPLVFMIMLISFPSGLIIYWTFSNLIGILQQLYVNKKK